MDDDIEALAKVKWALDHYGPADAEPFQFSRYESPAHAALAAVLAAGYVSPARHDADIAAARAAGAAEVVERVETVLAELESRDLDPWYWSDAVEPIRAALTTGGVTTSAGSSSDQSSFVSDNSAGEG